MSLPTLSKWKWKSLSHVWLFQPHGLYSPWDSPGQNTRVGSLSLLQGIFPTQGLNPGLLHCRQILSQLSHKGSPRILEWVAYPFSSGLSWPRNRTVVSCIAGSEPSLTELPPYQNGTLNGNIPMRNLIVRKSHTAPPFLISIWQMAFAKKRKKRKDFYCWQNSDHGLLPLSSSEGTPVPSLRFLRGWRDRLQRATSSLPKRFALSWRGFPTALVIQSPYRVIY